MGSMGYWAPRDRFDEASACYACCATFTPLKRRHHCRYCSHSFCSKCSIGRMPIPDHGVKKSVRVCNSCKDVIRGARRTELLDVCIEPHKFDYDLLVIGGGSGGLACARQAAKYGKSIAVCDFVRPSPQKTVWGLGGTCVNVGCIPKKLMHQASLLGEGLRDSKAFGWNAPSVPQHSWQTLVEGVQAHIQSINEGYIKSLNTEKITYFNDFASFKNRNTLCLTASDGSTRTVTARRVVIAVGGRPSYPDIPGAREHFITSDDIFSMKRHPGKKILVIGASYVALECAGFLHGVGCDVTVMVRSILLRGFDQEIAEKIGAAMEASGIKFLRGVVPVRAEKKEADDECRVTWKRVSNRDQTAGESKMDNMGCDSFNTVLCAIGREPCTKDLHLCCAQVMRDAQGKIPIYQEQTSQPNIYAVGDCAAVDRVAVPLELTPVAIQAGKLLADRLYGTSKLHMDYTNVATCVFTPLEYGCVGLTEEQAIKEFGDAKVEVYHQLFQPLEMSLPKRFHNSAGVSCYCKVVCNMAQGAKVIGFHFLGPNAGEVTQGVALAMKRGVTKEDMDMCIGIHPTVAEIFTTLSVSKGSGKSAIKEDC